jgi:hypothetical protein
MAAADMLISLARQVRPRTVATLRRAEPAWWTWAPAGTANHLLWHAGHALWVQDALCVAPLTGASDLPAGWERRFGMNAWPAADRGPWPDGALVADLLDRQLGRMEAVLAAADPAALDDLRPPGGGAAGAGWKVLHGLHDEAAHQGEMYLLLKLCRSGNGPRA